jgi:DNA ligase (NAD+)
LAKFLFAIGILHVGEYAAKLLAKNFKRLEDLYHVKQEKIEGVRQMGEKIAASVSGFFSDEKNLATLDELKRLGLRVENPDFSASDMGGLPLSGMTLVITGVMPVPRDEVDALIERHGGRASSSVSKGTHYVVAGDKPGTKLDRAKSLGVKVISYNDLLRMIEDRNKQQPKLF